MAVIGTNFTIFTVAFSAGGLCYWLADRFQQIPLIEDQLNLLGDLFLQGLGYSVGVAQFLYPFPLLSMLAHQRKLGWFVGVLLGAFLSLAANLRFFEWISRLS